MSNPPSKAERDRINAEIAKLRQPKTPAPTLTPTGSMRPHANAVDRQVRDQLIKDRQERAQEIEARLNQSKGKARDRFNER